jgi:hypothetical protein
MASDIANRYIPVRALVRPGANNGVRTGHIGRHRAPHATLAEAHDRDGRSGGLPRHQYLSATVIPGDRIEQALIGVAAVLVAVTRYASLPGSSQWTLDACWLLVLACTVLGICYCSPAHRRARASRARRDDADFRAVTDYLDQPDPPEETSQARCPDATCSMSQGNDCEGCAVDQVPDPPADIIDLAAPPEWPER